MEFVMSKFTHVNLAEEELSTHKHLFTLKAKGILAEQFHYSEQNILHIQ